MVACSRRGPLPPAPVLVGLGHVAYRRVTAGRSRDAGHAIYEVLPMPEAAISDTFFASALDHENVILGAFEATPDQ